MSVAREAHQGSARRAGGARSRARLFLSGVAVAGGFCALGALGRSHAAEPASPASLRAVADRYAADGDLDAAQATLDRLGAGAEDLLRALRAPLEPTAPVGSSSRMIEVTDGYGNKTDVLVVAPDAATLAKRGNRPLGLAVLLHGTGGKAKSARPWAEKIVASGEVVCVSPSATALPAEELRALKDGVPSFVKEKRWWAYEDPKSYVHAAIQAARALYPIDPDRVSLAGMSMGGYGTWNIGLRHPDHFAALLPLAGGISRFRVSDGDATTLALLENGRATPILSAHGTLDPLVPYGPDKEACDHLRSLGGRVTLHTLEGAGHELGGAPNAEGEVITEAIDFIVKARRETSPPAVTYVSLAEKLDGAYWLRIAARAPGAEQPRVEGLVDREANRVTVKSAGVAKTRVYLDERLLDSAREVTVESGGRVAWRGRLVPDVRAVLESWRSRRDPGLVYPACVDVAPGAPKVYR